ncbi:ABC1 kinase family protein [Nocardia puris]|uniref:Putative unusual protein kinase regulating ubiquinone biosynthesis (AarF/ABC1/UbiB family) n=1 Tax=Nocardia puris TaxID=208602 RepID=A0A366DJJ0_9NOCA|nr:AarF/ABC1/UbiB kinase family protein [Nocardia puris]RBO90243.1 putative unusual protein kinase regulating ubiquinone biosynthesis (AarF/ABC1/UbiB family) [Nocardia puris]
MVRRDNDGRILKLPRRVDAGGDPPTGGFARTTRLAGLPVAFAGRRMAGAGKRMLGRSAEEIDRDIQARTAQHLFEVLGELKGCVAKLGQLMALYELALPADFAAPYRDALGQLQDSAPAMLPPMVHRVLAQQLGPTWRTRFLEFEDRPAAAASVGQVHRAVWHDGRRVAVKIMYPGAREAVLSDLQALRRIAPLFTALLPGADSRAVIEALCAYIGEELDYELEAAHQRAFAAAYADDPDFVVPDVVARIGDVLITDWLDGVSLSRVLGQNQPLDRDRAGLLVLRFLLSGPVRAGLLYGDPHPGNFRIMPDGRLGVVDFGACAPFPPGYLDALTDMARAILSEDPTDIEAAIRRRGYMEPDRAVDIPRVLHQLAPIRDAMLDPTFRMTTTWLRKRVSATVDLRLSNVIRQLTMPAEHTPMLRTFLAGISVMSQLQPELPLREECNRWFPDVIAALGLDDLPPATKPLPALASMELPLPQGNPPPPRRISAVPNISHDSAVPRPDDDR